MINRREIVSMLTSFGLTGLEAELYLTLLIKGESEAKEIVRMLNIHFPQFYSIASNLARKGFIETQEGRPKKYRAMDVKEIVEREKRKMRENAELLLETVKKLRNTQSTKRRPSIWITRGLQNILYHVNEIVNDAQFDVTVILHNEFVSKIVESLVESRRKGVQTFLITYPAPPGSNSMHQLSEIKRVRLFETCPFGISVVADCQKAILAHGFPNTFLREEPYGVVFFESLVPTFLSENFYNVWEHAKPLVPEENDQFPKTFRSQRLALVEIKELLKKGEVTVGVKGRHIKTGTSFEEIGIVSEVNETQLLKNFVLKIQSGKKIKIGGPYSTLEEVEAELITILKIR